MQKNNRAFVIILGIACCVFCCALGHAIQPSSAEQILRSYVDDFRIDPAAAEPISFGIRIKDEERGEWQVVVGGKKDREGSYQVELQSGLPSAPSVLYTLDLATLKKLDRGEVNALTAMGRARASDPTPMDIELMESFQPEPEFFARFIPLTFHFWTRGFPETVDFGKQQSRNVHGANMVVLYYQKGLRSAWAQIDKGQHVNSDPNDQKNPFPTMIIGIRGKAVARIGGKEVILRAGQLAFIPAGINHEAWNPYDEPAEIILLMFGEGA
jgi:mannose-6-phosphate isomerase-like protein (cupin superfamily)